MRLADLRENLPDFVADVRGVGDDVEDPARQFHDAERMFEPLVRRRRIEHVGQRELVDVPQPLERPRVQDRTLVRVQPDEDVDRVADLVQVLAHHSHGSL